MFVDDIVRSARNIRGGLLRKQQSEGPVKFTLVSGSASCQDTQSFSSILPADEKSVVTSSADDSLLMGRTLDTSTLRRQLSDLQFDSTSLPKDVRSQAKSASDIILSRNSSMDATKPACSPAKPQVQRLRRRKQEFDQLLQTPPDDRQFAKTRTGVEHRRSEADSGFVSYCESGNSAIDCELKLLAENAVMRSRTPPRQIRVRSPVGDIAEPSIGEDDADLEEDVNLMLFTPFKIDGNELPELSPDIELSASIVAGSDSWVSFTPISTGARARTSTPCRLLETMMENQSECARSHRNAHTSPRLSLLLSEFNDNSLCPFDGVTGCRNVPLGDLTSSGVLTLDEAVEMDVVDLSFSELR